MKIRLLIIAFVCLSYQTSQSQMVNNYTIGVNSLGDYGMRIDRGNDNSKFSFSYSSLNSFNLSPGKNFVLTQPGSLNMGMFGVSYNKRKPLTSKLDLFYGSEVNLISSMQKNNNLANSPGGNYLPNLNLNIGLKYKITDNIHISAAVIQGYGYGLGYSMGNNLFNYGMPSLFNNNW
jgi:hypothetical protein